LSQSKIHIIGIGDDGLQGLTAAASSRVAEAELLIGAKQALVLVKSPAERYEFAGDLEAVIRKLQAAGDKRIVMLASGDPMFYGTARFLCDRLGKDRFEVTPHVSSMQLAFARVKESWDEAYLTNLATQSLERVVERTRTAEKVGLFTTEQVSPAAVAKALLERKLDYFFAYICENLGSPDERVTQSELPDILGQEFSPLNVMILVRKPNSPDRPATMLGRRMFGNPDEAFLQSQPKRGLLTPAELRAVALAELDIGPASVVWDVGAGSGSVAIEAAQIASAGQVFAIEMDPEDYSLISANAERFQVSNLTPILGQAPAAWQGLPAPDAIFIGGSGRHVPGIVEQALAVLKPGGRIVITVGSIENVAACRLVLQQAGTEMQVWMLNFCRGTEQLERLRFEAINPTFLLRGVK